MAEHSIATALDGSPKTAIAYVGETEAAIRWFPFDPVYWLTLAHVRQIVGAAHDGR